MELLKKLLMHAREAWYRKARIWLPFNPRKGKCEACGKTHTDKGKPIRSQLHHWEYAFSTAEVRKNPLLVLEHTSELCYHCHQLADCIRRLYEAMEKNPKVVKKLFKLREEALNG